jgi:hypothetical protein
MAERNPATDPAIVDALVNGTTPILSARPDRARISARSMSRMARSVSCDATPSHITTP